jgi:hypothetical protein
VYRYSRRCSGRLVAEAAAAAWLLLQQPPPCVLAGGSPRAGWAGGNGSLGASAVHRCVVLAEQFAVVAVCLFVPLILAAAWPFCAVVCCAEPCRIYAYRGVLHRADVSLRLRLREHAGGAHGRLR